MKYSLVLIMSCILISSQTHAVPVTFPYEEWERQNPRPSVAPPAAVSVPVISPTAPSTESLAVPSAPAATSDHESKLLSAPSAVAGDRYAKHCTPTPALSRRPYPGKTVVPTSNRLARPKGKSLFADGQRLYLTGRVFDAACVPLREARVELWQADATGQYRYATLGELANPYATFAGAGQVETDNRGEYLFETIMPAATANQTSYINLRVTHPAMRMPLVTTLYFADNPRNMADPVYRRLPEVVKQKVTSATLPFSVGNATDAVRVHHDVTVQARDGFRSF
jgi:protocatechuate 3,4-dioxygenase, alpha subunit